MYERILVATDDSPEADVAVDQAIGLAEAEGASLHALFVVDRRFDRTEAMSEPFVQAGDTALREVEVRAAERGIDVTTTLERGDPAETILTYAESMDADLIVLGGKRPSTAKRFFIGDVTERVARHASTSVLIVRE
ncbi:universal stress protein [Halorubrum vacuolatum]|uniref:Nucleotide-binding universal stress protein, UspA family n=1 Tax=Halorubrum vacuolatum TaxID=63740 RepID=A0A238USE7_HALVU|nr:universal stress protein [Halorubrum vacuolatum]SNR25070.1 Nucleotide-binding universal stress protein, UspA family [Halorubrum vacuolatum]